MTILKLLQNSNCDKNQIVTIVTVVTVLTKSCFHQKTIFNQKNSNKDIKMEKPFFFKENLISQKQNLTKNK